MNRKKVRAQLLKMLFSPDSWLARSDTPDIDRERQGTGTQKLYPPCIPALFLSPLSPIVIYFYFVPFKPIAFREETKSNPIFERINLVSCPCLILGGVRNVISISFVMWQRCQNKMKRDEKELPHLSQHRLMLFMDLQVEVRIATLFHSICILINFIK